MGLFDSLQNLISGATDSALGSVGDAVGNLTEVPLVQDVQEQVSAITDGVTEPIATITEQAQSSIGDITQNFEL